MMMVMMLVMIVQTDLERARFLLSEALDEDEKGDVEDAIDLYTQAVELCIKVVSLVQILAPTPNTHTHTHTHSVCLSLSHTHTHTHTHCLSVCLSVSHTHSHTQTCTPIIN